MDLCAKLNVRSEHTKTLSLANVSFVKLLVKVATQDLLTAILVTLRVSSSISKKKNAVTLAIQAGQFHPRTPTLFV